MYIYIIKYPLALHKASFALQERMCVVPCSGSSPLPPEGKLARSSAEALLSGTDTSPYGTWICFGPDALKDNTTHVKSLRDARLHLMYRHIEMFYIQYMYAYGAYCVCACIHEINGNCFALALYGGRTLGRFSQQMHIWVKCGCALLFQVDLKPCSRMADLLHSDFL